MSLGVNRNFSSQPIRGPKQTESKNNTQGPGKTAKAKPSSGGEKAEANKDVANISTDLQVVGAAATVALFGPVPATLAGTVAVKALVDTVNTLPAAERIKQATEQLATQFVNALKAG